MFHPFWFSTEDVTHLSDWINGWKQSCFNVGNEHEKKCHWEVTITQSNCLLALETNLNKGKGPGKQGSTDVCSTVSSFSIT